MDHVDAADKRRRRAILPAEKESDRGFGKALADQGNDGSRDDRVADTVVPDEKDSGIARKGELPLTGVRALPLEHPQIAPAHRPLDIFAEICQGFLR
jgi:hypothetical protein